MIIVAGWLRVDRQQRQEYLDACRPAIEAARRAPGCLDYYLAADPLEDDRINVFERWTDTDSVERFRGSGPSSEQQAVIIKAQVHQHDIASTVSLT
ncbi:MAG: antibiotic biosynthesis monooxygenase family protein [Ilumatobacteraceae bacterium]